MLRFAQWGQLLVLDRHSHFPKSCLDCPRQREGKNPSAKWPPPQKMRPNDRKERKQNLISVCLFSPQEYSCLAYNFGNEVGMMDITYVIRTIVCPSISARKSIHISGRFIPYFQPCVNAPSRFPRERVYNAFQKRPYFFFFSIAFHDARHILAAISACLRASLRFDPRYEPRSSCTDGFTTWPYQR